MVIQSLLLLNCEYGKEELQLNVSLTFDPHGLSLLHLFLVQERHHRVALSRLLFQHGIQVIIVTVTGERFVHLVQGILDGFFLLCTLCHTGKDGLERGQQCFFLKKIKECYCLIPSTVAKPTVLVPRTHSASNLAHPSQDGDGCLCPWARHLTINCFSPPRKRWVPAMVHPTACSTGSIKLKIWRHALRLVNYTTYRPCGCHVCFPEIQLWPWLVASASLKARRPIFNTTYPIKSLEWYACLYSRG